MAYGWYLIGPLIAVGLVGFLGVVFWRMGLHWTLAGDRDFPPDPYAGGLAIFGEPIGGPFGEAGDYGLLAPAAVTVDPGVADDIRELLCDAGIRATHAVDPDGRMAVLVFTEELEEARRLVGGSPAL